VLPGLRRFDPVSEALAKLIAPASDCLVCHGYTALEEQFLDVAQAQLKAEIPTHSATDDLGWETVTVIERFGFLHHAILRDRASNLTTPESVKLQAERENLLGELALARSKLEANEALVASLEPRAAGAESPSTQAKATRTPGGGRGKAGRKSKIE
jgi:hypothetical protein